MVRRKRSDQEDAVLLEIESICGLGSLVLTIGQIPEPELRRRLRDFVPYGIDRLFVGIARLFRYQAL